jgi:hypothetical protein
MSDQDFKRGKRDGREGIYSPPVPERIITSRPKEEQERLDEYNQGVDHGRQERKERKK